MSYRMSVKHPLKMIFGTRQTYSFIKEDELKLPTPYLLPDCPEGYIFGVYISIPM